VCTLDYPSSSDNACLYHHSAQSLKHECYETSAMAELLLTKATLSPRIAHYLYWYVHIPLGQYSDVVSVHSLPLLVRTHTARTV